MRSALANSRILSDDGFVDDHVLLLDGSRIEALVGADDPRCRDADWHDLGGGLLLPGFIDVQVNGGGGVLFNDAPSVDTLRTIAAAHRRFGTTGLLPTLISDDSAVIARAIDAVRAALAAGVPGVLGIHIEGPCLNEERRGAHDASKFRDLDESDIALLTSLGAGRTVVTLAPEMTSPATIARLAAAGVVVSAGHTNASASEIGEALRHGVTGFTHLFNAMSPLTSREPGTVGAALLDPHSWCGIIVDGHHVDPRVLRLALACKRHDRFMLITDAMSSVGAEQDSFMLQGRRISVADGVCIDQHGVLSGSALDMASALRNAVAMLGLPLESAARMASRQPAEFLGLGDQLGRLAPGYRANLVQLDASLAVQATWIDGAASGRPGEAPASSRRTRQPSAKR
jgi:N-acetylglucosamine-6-phosphate deacetylase